MRFSAAVDLIVDGDDVVVAAVVDLAPLLRQQRSVKKF